MELYGRAGERNGRRTTRVADQLPASMRRTLTAKIALRQPPPVVRYLVAFTSSTYDAGLHAGFVPDIASPDVMNILRAARRGAATFGRAVSARLLWILCWAVVPQLSVAQGVAAAPDTASMVAPPYVAAQRASEVAVGIGDRIRVRVWREPTMSDDFTVDDRGTVTLARVGAVPVAGRSIAAVRDTLLARYAVYLKNPSIDVTVFRRVGVQGEVRAPNLYYVDATKSVREVVTEAGGPTENANRDHVSVVRDGRTLAVGRWRDGGPSGVELRSGDQVVVARRSWFSINALAIVGTLGVIVPVALSVISFVK